ncbi:cytochrome c-550 [Oculatella sp. LEGE 06141]|uniref:photosystem II cytochrome c-550 n=1 Tax=Oculatella sp. LEGE 06141 TaxID=1828648 RepID=UPI0018806474|nr:photosystem II cytochrome c-550 [Oculatella sp. LEGE 06141]MBE9178111.1 cytochrome c-550 [Oculatella sp. LEGE 06141]
MFKRSIWLVAVTLFLAFQLFAGGAIAAQLDEATRTLPLTEEGETVVISEQQVVEGKRLFNYACAQCHVGGGTKTDPNVSLGLQTLALASPPRDNIEALVDYMHNPTTYDGLQDIAELHPSTQSADIYPKMRNLTEDDLYAIAGHILLQPKVAKGWAGGKAFY